VATGFGADHDGMIRRGVLAVVAVLALAACSGTTPEPAPPYVPGTTVLSKTSGWRAALDPETASHYMVVEIAYDEATARRAWAENVPAGAVARNDLPVTDGLYGSFDAVDLTKQRIVVVEAGQSGSCPGWIRGISTRADGTVEVSQGTKVPPGADGCTADYNAYRTVLAVDAGRLPAVTDLSATGPRALVDGATIDSGVLVVPYPYVPLFPTVTPS
jgi:hypothetical protein